VSIWEVILLGIIQGITEFLPVSSSGHLTLGQLLLGLQDPSSYIVFDLVCHLGTLVAILAVFRQEIFSIMRGNVREAWRIIVGTLPLFPLLLVLKQVKNAYDTPELLGLFFLITALLLYLGMRLRLPSPKRPWRTLGADPFAVGIFQALAVLPGISRSGSTISAAHMLGWTRKEAVAFSFLLAIPAILGGSVLEIYKLFAEEQVSAAHHIGMGEYFLGFVLSATVGWVALRLLIRMVLQDKLMVFVWYCGLLGLACLWYFNFVV